MPISVAEPSFFGSIVGLLTSYRHPGKHKPKQYGGVIDLAAGTVDVSAANPEYCARNAPFCATLSAGLTRRLRTAPGEGNYSYQGLLQWKDLVKVVDSYRSVEMAQRYRPMTAIEQVGWGSQTPSMQALLARSWGAMGGRASVRRKKRSKKKGASVRVRRVGKRRSSSRPAHLVKGSLAARRHMARLRRLAKRARRKTAAAKP